VKYQKEAVESILLNEDLIGVVSDGEVKATARVIKKKQVVGPNRKPVEVWRILEDVSIGWLKYLFYELLVERKIPGDLRKSFIASTFKNKGDVK